MSSRSKTFEQQVSERYDAVSNRYASFYLRNNRTAHFFNARVGRVKELLAGHGGGQLLEVGCGPGLLVEHVVGEGFTYQGLDISKGMISVCQERHAHLTNARFAVGDLQSIPFPDRSFDAVLALGVLEYVTDEVKAFEQMSRVLRPGGIAVISAINSRSPYNLWDRFVYRRFAVGNGETFAREYHSLRQYTAILAQTALELIDVVYFDFSLLPPPLDRYKVRLQHALSRRLEVLGRSVARELGNGFLLKVRRLESLPVSRESNRQVIPAFAR